MKDSLAVLLILYNKPEVCFLLFVLYSPPLPSLQIPCLPLFNINVMICPLQKSIDEQEREEAIHLKLEKMKEISDKAAEAAQSTAERMFEFAQLLKQQAVELRVNTKNS